MKTKDMIGKTFERWKVFAIYSMGKRPKVWCQCICGNRRVVNADTIKKGKSKSCGCFQKERVKEKLTLQADIRQLNKKYSIYKTSAKIRNYEFTLNKQEFHDIIITKCFYCNKKDSLFNGIDRVDNSKGYILGNCVSCCHICNDLKSTVTKEIILKASEFFKNVT